MLILSKCLLLYTTGTLGFELLNKVFVRDLVVYIYNNYINHISTVYIEFYMYPMHAI